MLHANKTPADVGEPRERDSKLETAVSSMMRKAKDPASRLRLEDAPPLDFMTLYHVSIEPDHRGLRYVLYVTNDGSPMTAWVTKDKPYELVSVEAGW